MCSPPGGVPPLPGGVPRRGPPGGSPTPPGGSKHPILGVPPGSPRVLTIFFAYSSGVLGTPHPRRGGPGPPPGGVPPLPGGVPPGGSRYPPRGGYPPFS